MHLIKSDVVFGVIGGACAGLAVGVIFAEKFSNDWAANIVGAGLAAALAIWGAFAVAARQATEREREFETFAAEVVSNIRDEAEYGSLMIVDFEAEKDPEVSTRRRTRALFQIRRLLMAVEVFEEHVSKVAAGSFKLRRAALVMDKAIADAKGFMTSARS